MKIQTIIYLCLILIFSSCSAANIARLRSSNMDKLELGMSREQLSDVLGSSYTIAEKYTEDEDKIEVISYRNFPYEEEFYLFKFRNGKLEKWYRELQPKYNEASHK
ncbi:hypothetical protein [Sphingobacterium sp.]|uniref:hypothetical protein n=2 Tax=Sphingobacterium sp. TaxID=341027 RepID=UPI0028A22660|nr:hypothetical protein [Sphingobacterium sp.]